MFQIRTPNEYDSYKKQHVILKSFNVNSQDYLGNTLLHLAVLKGNCDLVKTLLDEEEIDYKIKNIEGLASVFYLKNIKKDADVEKMLGIFLDKIGPEIFTLFDNNRKNILEYKSIQKAVIKLQNFKQD